MVTPCPRCGSSETQPARHGLIHFALWKMGCHLRRCADCNRLRVLKRMDRSHPYREDMEQLRQNFHRDLQATASDYSATSEARGAQHRVRPLQALAEFEMIPPDSSIGIAEDPERMARARHVCPRCGGGDFVPSRRRWYERCLIRPKMARCIECTHRFPAPF